jgi:hypothetical protein
MSNFQVSITSPTTELPDVTVSSGVLSIVDHSNYSTSDEVGHLEADFANFYKMLITLPSGDEYLYSSLYPVDGDELIDTPDAGAPDADYTYPSGDGQYWLTIYALPTYSGAVSYVYSTSNPIYVYYPTDGKIYKNIQSTGGVDLIADPTYWTEVTDIELLPSKYRLNQRIVIYADSKSTYARLIYRANALNNIIGENWEKILKDSDAVNAIRMFIGINAIPVLLAASRFDEIDTTINNLKSISSAYETL